MGLQWGGASVGVVYNMDSPSQFGRGIGLGSEWPLSSIHLLCKAGGFGRTPLWNFACQTQKLNLSNRGVTAGFGFAGLGLDVPAFFTLSPGSSVATDFFSWGPEMVNGDLGRPIRMLIDSIGPIPSNAEELGNLFNELNPRPH